MMNHLVWLSEPEDVTWKKRLARHCFDCFRSVHMCVCACVSKGVCVWEHVCECVCVHVCVRVCVSESADRRQLPLLFLFQHRSHSILIISSPLSNLKKSKVGLLRLIFIRCQQLIGSQQSAKLSQMFWIWRPNSNSHEILYTMLLLSLTSPLLKLLCWT